VLVTEAMSGLRLQGEDVNETSVHDWVAETLEGVDQFNEIHARAMHFAGRIFHGPVHVVGDERPLKFGER
jgi:hypothetical protein